MLLEILVLPPSQGTGETLAVAVGAPVGVALGRGSRFTPVPKALEVATAVWSAPPLGTGQWAMMKTVESAPSGTWVGVRYTSIFLRVAVGTAVPVGAAVPVGTAVSVTTAGPVGVG